MALNVLGRAYIEVHADTSPFAKEMLKEVEAISTAAEQQSQGAGKRIGRGLAQGVERETARSAPKVASRIFAAFSNIFRRNSNRRLFNSTASNRFAQEAADVGTKMGASLGSSFFSTATGALGAVGKSVTSLLGSLGSSIGNVGANGPFAASIGLLIVTGIPAIVGAVIALISVLGPLLNLLFLLPAALGGAVAAIVPLTFAFKGFGTAVAAVASGDLKAINEAMKELTPSARAVAREVGGLAPAVKELGRVAQESFFSRLTGGKVTAAWKSLTGTLKSGFATVGTAAGDFGAKLLALAASPEVQKFLAAMFKLASESFFGTLGNAILNFLRVMALLGVESLPALQRLTAGFARMIDKFSAWIEESIRSGEFDRFMDKLFKALDNVGRLLSSGKNFIVSVIGGPEQQAHAQLFFDDIIKTIDDLTAFFKSDQGKRAISAMIGLADTFLWILKNTLLIFLQIIAAIDLIIEGIIELIGLLPGVNLPGAKWQPPRVARQTFGAAPGHAEGGDFNREHLAWISEGNKRELVIPMTDPSRARDIANRSGLSTMLKQDTIVNVYVGNEKLMSYVDRGVKAGVSQFGRAMARGPRPVGVNG